ncbi:MAG: rhomboid family intramembrane serine protease [Streptococcus thermophilus]
MGPSQYNPLELWRLITPIFVHIGVEHFLFNMLTLYFMGRMAEQIFGTLRFSLFTSWCYGKRFPCFTPNVIAAGASTSLFGLFSAIVILGYYSHSPLLNQLGRNYLALIVINLIFNLFTPSVGITGHLGGLVGGALAAIFLANKVESRLFSKGWRFTSFLTYVTLLLIVLGFTYL